ncbi:membrane protein insertase YidC [Alkalihalobacterium chitinilyticum]|uniref:Membrane protein insertase YidC n=1 Tax=Alkalihalobacterium chitinilyticum TaxID=2980103 RepID=A0ABT5VJQ1_9BACI|nr:membrane protein insertase YidC [Alkalihalobacterium chitinilyticum]MDE5414957.1 membrane protein insertase YidC [Alkalihalobacterium chitinilyticum]
MKKTTNTFILFILLIGCTLLLASCGATTQPITAESTGVWNHYFVYPLSWLITFVAQLFNGSFGLSIIVVTIFIRLMILPLTLKQNRSSRVMQAIKPEMEALKDRYNMKDPKEQQKFQKEMLSIYQKHGVNPMAGCLPILIQMPVLMAFYFAIMRTEEIARHSFLWFNLGSPDPLFILPIVAAVTTFIQGKLTMRTLPANMQVTIYIMPAMILMAALAMPSALALYWVIGNLFMIVQSYFLYGKTKDLELNV